MVVHCTSFNIPKPLYKLIRTQELSKVSNFTCDLKYLLILEFFFTTRKPNTQFLDCLSCNS